MRLLESSSLRSKILRHLIGLDAAPVIPLYILSYRLMGKRCVYHWGETDVRPLDPLTENQYVFTRLFPGLVLLAAFGVLVGVSWLVGKPILLQF